MALDYSIELEANIQPTDLIKLINEQSGIPYVSGDVLQDPVLGADPGISSTPLPTNPLQQRPT